MRIDWPMPNKHPTFFIQTWELAVALIPTIKQKKERDRKKDKD